MPADTAVAPPYTVVEEGAVSVNAELKPRRTTKPLTVGDRFDVEVTVRHLDGKEETFKKEVASLELIVTPDGSIRYVHLILIGGTEKDTHLWYNYNNIASLRYRFLHITESVDNLKKQRPGSKNWSLSAKNFLQGRHPGHQLIKRSKNN